MRIGIVNDSGIALESLRQMISAAGFTVAWLARNGREAVMACAADKPDIVLMDLIMPEMNGVDATRQIMKTTPCPILIVTGSIDTNVALVFAAMGAGAIDVVNTPTFDSKEDRRYLMEKIAAISTLSGVDFKRNDSSPASTRRLPPDGCVLIGSSAGGPPALLEIVKALPTSLSVAVIIVQHVDEQFAPELASWLGGQSKLPVRMAEERTSPQRGEVFISRGGAHLMFGPGGRFLYADEPRLSYQPSVDVFFRSALSHGPRRLMGVLLTGMGKDGAEGLKCLRAAKHLTVAQDEATSAIYGMPRAAAEIGAAKEVLPLSTIAARIIQWSQSFS